MISFHILQVLWPRVERFFSDEIFELFTKDQMNLSLVHCEIVSRVSSPEKIQ